MGIPPALVGLITWLCLTRYGPLGYLGLLYTTIVIAQAIIAMTLVTGFTIAAIQALYPKMHLQILSQIVCSLPAVVE